MGVNDDRRTLSLEVETTFVLGLFDSWFVDFFCSEVSTNLLNENEICVVGMLVVLLSEIELSVEDLFDDGCPLKNDVTGIEFPTEEVVVAKLNTLGGSLTFENNELEPIEELEPFELPKVNVPKFNLFVVSETVVDVFGDRKEKAIGLDELVVMVDKEAAVVIIENVEPTDFVLFILVLIKFSFPVVIVGFVNDVFAIEVVFEQLESSSVFLLNVLGSKRFAENEGF